MTDKDFLKFFSSSLLRKEAFTQSSNRGIYLYGAGFVGQWALQYLTEIGEDVIAFVDSNAEKQSHDFMGLPVFSLDQLSAEEISRIIITSVHHISSIRKMISKCSGKNPTDFDVMTINEYVILNKGLNEIDRTAQKFGHDSFSYRMYWNILKVRLSGSLKYLKRPDALPPGGYFSKFGFFNKQLEDMVDVGAYVGDTVERFIWSVNGVFNKIYAFEPHPLSFQALEYRVQRLYREWALPNEAIETVCAALWRTNEKLSFSDSGAMQRLTENLVTSTKLGSDGEITSVALDKYLEGRPASLLKIDAEGSERQVIEGAKNTIEGFKPRIAVAIYHYPTDIFDIPENLSNINPNYEYSLDHLASNANEMILFCSDKID